MRHTPAHMSFQASRDTLLLQLSVIGDSVTSLRTQVSELGGALIETERRRLLSKLRAIEAEHARILQRLTSQH